MRVLGFDDFNFVAPLSVAGASIEGYTFGVRADVILSNTVEPTVLPRPGTFPTFGLPVIGALYLQGEFGYGPPGSLQLEEALRLLWKRLKVTSQVPRQLRVQRNSQIGTAFYQTTPAMLLVPQYSSSQAINFQDSTFIIPSAEFLSATPVSGSVTL